MCRKPPKYVTHFPRQKKKSGMLPLHPPRGGASDPPSNPPACPVQRSETSTRAKNITHTQHVATSHNSQYVLDQPHKPFGTCSPDPSPILASNIFVEHISGSHEWIHGTPKISYQNFPCSPQEVISYGLGHITRTHEMLYK
jgi:hypothetical protein